MAVNLATSLRLKLQSATRAVRLAEDLRDRISGLTSPLLRSDGNRSIEALLPGDVWVTAAVESDNQAAVLMSGLHHQPRLECDGVSAPVRVMVPRFYQQETAGQRPMWQVATLLGPLLGVNIGAACSVVLRGATCSFCGGTGPVSAGAAFPMSVDEVVEALRAAFRSGRDCPVYFNLPYLNDEDGGIAFLEPYVRAVKRQLRTVVAVQMHPPRSNTWIDRAYAMGVDALSFAIEVHDPQTFATHFPGRARDIGRERYYEALAYAAKLFPRGTVWSELVLGLEPVASTHNGIDALLEIGVLPVLGLATASSLDRMGLAHLVEVDQVLRLSADLYRAAHKSAVPLGWIRELSFALTPYEARVLADYDPPIAATTNLFHRSLLSRLTATYLSPLRRRRRVRQMAQTSLRS